MVAFDKASPKHLAYQKAMSLPIVVIDTDSYVQKLIHSLEEKFASYDWDSYIELKRNLFFSIEEHPWLFIKYFNLQTLYEDVRIFQDRLKMWELEKVSASFLEKQLRILERLISLNEELENLLENRKKTSFQYRKKMLQYEQIED